MRISADKTDPGYRPAVFLRGIEIYVNGAEVRHCITADDVAGFVTAYALDEAGKLRLADGALEKVTLTGEVRISMPYELAVQIQDHAERLTGTE